MTPRKLLYGAFVEKIWRVAMAKTHLSPAQLLQSFPARETWTVLPCPSRYRFLADPFPHPTGGILAEALRRSDEQGEIVHIAGDRTLVLCAAKGHLSYPGTVTDGSNAFLVPESASWSPPRLYRFDGERVEYVGDLPMECPAPLLDPTLHTGEDGTLYLFANRAEDGPDVVRLWTSRSLDDVFAEHPCSPIRSSALGSRMAGALVSRDGRLFRLGQDSSRRYGDGLALFEVTRLTPSAYSEQEVGLLRFSGVRGPHTLNFTSEGILFDFYEERVSLLAGVRRVRALLSARRAVRDMAAPATSG